MQQLEPNGHATEFLAAEAVPVPVPENKAPERCDLDDETLAFLADLDRQTALLSAQIEGQRSGALAMFVRRRGLSGTWGLSEDRRGLVKRD